MVPNQIPSDDLDAAANNIEVVPSKATDEDYDGEEEGEEEEEIDGEINNDDDDDVLQSAEMLETEEDEMITTVTRETPIRKISLRMNNNNSSSSIKYNDEEDDDDQDQDSDDDTVARKRNRQSNNNNKRSNTDQEENDSDFATASFAPGGILSGVEEQLQKIKQSEFLKDLYQFMEEKGRPITKLPSLGYQELDLFKLYWLVVSRGGMDEVSINDSFINHSLLLLH